MSPERPGPLPPAWVYCEPPQPTVILGHSSLRKISIQNVSPDNLDVSLSGLDSRGGPCQLTSCCSLTWGLRWTFPY